jgi:NAD(P)-dependent dehydrogenase (short-subunit alcohol dehydrogenase family)
MTEQGTIVVTGGGRGIGAAICTQLAADGYAVLVNYAGNAAAAAKVVDAITADGGRAAAYQADVSQPDQIAGMFDHAERVLGPLAGLVNNAGIVGDMKRIDQHDAASLEAVFKINVVGAMLCAGEAVRRLSTKHGGKGGSIVTVGSIAATTGGIPGMVAYATSKGAIAAFTIALAKEVAREGIRVNAVAPGMIVTDMTQGFADRVGPTVPIGRCGEPHEIAAAVAWLMSDAASYAVGTMLTVSGGR